MDRNMSDKGVRKIWDRYKFVGLIVLAGAMMLLWPRGEGTEKAALPVEPESQTDLQVIQSEMEEILGKISGVGQVQLMLTLESEGEQQLAQDTELSYSGSTVAPEDYSRSSEVVRIDRDDGENPVITKQICPTYRGALVVCQGGDRPEVKLAVTQAVAALTGLAADRITVEKWQ